MQEHESYQWDSLPGSGTSGKPSEGEKKKAQTILYLYLPSNALSYYKLELKAFTSKQK